MTVSGSVCLSSVFFILYVSDALMISHSYNNYLCLSTVQFNKWLWCSNISCSPHSFYSVLSIIAIDFCRNDVCSYTHLEISIALFPSTKIQRDWISDFCANKQTVRQTEVWITRFCSATQFSQIHTVFWFSRYEKDVTSYQKAIGELHQGHMTSTSLPPGFWHFTVALYCIFIKL